MLVDGDPLLLRGVEPVGFCVERHLEALLSQHADGQHLRREAGHDVVVVDLEDDHHDAVDLESRSRVAVDVVLVAAAIGEAPGAAQGAVGGVDWPVGLHARAVRWPGACRSERRGWASRADLPSCDWARGLRRLCESREVGVDVRAGCAGAS